MKTKPEFSTQFEANLSQAGENNSISNFASCKNDQPFIGGRKTEKFSPIYRQVIQSRLISRANILSIACGKFPQTVNNNLLVKVLLLLRTCRDHRPTDKTRKHSHDSFIADSRRRCTDTRHYRCRLHNRLFRNFPTATPVKLEHHSDNERTGVVDCKHSSFRCVKVKLSIFLELIYFNSGRHGTGLPNWRLDHAKVWQKIRSLLSLHTDDTRLVSNFPRRRYGPDTSRAISDR